LVIDVSVANVGYADANKPFNVSVFADDVYIGTKEINEILKAPPVPQYLYGTDL